MAALLRSAKSGSQWTRNELLAYNIVVDVQRPIQFFHSDPASVSIDAVDPAFVSHTIGDDCAHLTDDTNRLVQYLDLASRTNAGQESAIDDFARELLRMLGFEPRDMLLRARYAIPFTNCGETRSAQTDICLLDHRSTILLLLQEDTSMTSFKDPEPQLIAGAIAAFQANNRARTGWGSRSSRK